MKQPESVMSKRSKEEFLEWCRRRYPKRDRKGKSRMLDETCETLGWDRKHAIKALNGRVALGRQAKKRGRHPKYGPCVGEVVVAIWRLSEYAGSVHLKALLPHWLPFWEDGHGRLEKTLREKVLGVSIRQLDRITGPHRIESPGRGRRPGRRSHRLKEQVPVRCGPWEVTEAGWMEADTVSHGGGSGRGDFAHTLTLTDIHSGWTVLHGIWCLSAGGVVRALDRVEESLPFALKGFDSDNGSEFLNEVLEAWLAGRKVHWTRSRPYKKNDQAHVEQKNFTHVRQL
ncbi:MAG TPA: transposase family protein, partial [Bacteroidia bacterium]|nr:transposase family protein [Bacteroidia bacterium]